MKSKIIKILVAIILISGAAGFYYYLMPAPGVVTTDNAYVHGEISHVSAEVSGVVTEVLVTDNQYVEAGQVLATLDDSTYQALKSQAVGAFKVAQATVANVNQRIAFQKISIDEAATRVVAAKADADFQYREWRRFADLLKKKLISASRYDGQQTRQQKTHAALDSTNLQLAAAKQQLNTLYTEREQITARLEQSKANLKLAEIRLADTKIYAPISGIVGNRAIRIGRYVNQGSPLLAIVPIDNIWVEANYKEGQITHIKPGQTVMITLDSFPDHQLTGTVLSISPATGAQFSLLPPDNATGNFVKIVQRVPIKISIVLPKELQGRVVPGLSAEVEVDTNTKA
jgi:membrane fusion protein (multidrug efflux system)